MNPIIFNISQADKEIVPEFSFGEMPSPLIKFGFLSISEYELTKNEHYRVCLELNEKELISKIKKDYKINNFSLEMANIYEIMNLFGMLNLNQNMNVDIEPVTELFQTISKTKFKYIQSKKPSLVIKHFSEIDIDEAGYVHLLINELPEILNSQQKGSSMILQIFNIQTQPFVELIYYLSSLYLNSYLVKPSSSSAFSDSKYLVLTGLKTNSKLKEIKIKKNTYLNSVTDEIPDTFISAIQKFNSIIIKNKLNISNKIKNYLDTNVFEGLTYQDNLNEQNKNLNLWIEKFSQLDKMRELFEASDISSIK